MSLPPVSVEQRRGRAAWAVLPVNPHGFMGVMDPLFSSFATLAGPSATATPVHLSLQLSRSRATALNYRYSTLLLLSTAVVHGVGSLPAQAPEGLVYLISSTNGTSSRKVDTGYRSWYIFVSCFSLGENRKRDDVLQKRDAWAAVLNACPTTATDVGVASDGSLRDLQISRTKESLGLQQWNAM